MEKVLYTPSDAELEILQILWELKEARVKDIFEKLRHEKEVGYTTVLKTMQIMFDKGVLERKADGKSHIYRPTVAREEIQEKYLDKILHKVYKGSTFNLVMSALGNYKASSKELKQIKDLIKKQESKES